MEPIHRVFFHELGHFVAGEINRKHYSGTGISGILFYPSEENYDLFCGETIPIVPENAIRGGHVPLERAAEYLASLIYGCIFQSYYFKQPTLNSCLDHNGKKDLSARTLSIAKNGLVQSNEKFSKAEDSYYSQLVETKSLDLFMPIDPQAYLREIKKYNYDVNMLDLRRDTDDLIQDHLRDYKCLISEFKAIIKLDRENSHHLG